MLTNTNAAVLSFWLQFECCGVENSSDFNEAEKWNKTKTFGAAKMNMIMPIACCHTDIAHQYVKDKKVSSNVEKCTTDLKSGLNNGNVVGFSLPQN